MHDTACLGLVHWDDSEAEDAAHPLSLGFRRQSIKQSRDLHLSDEEQHSRALLIATGEAIPLRGLEGVPGLPGAPQDEAGLTRSCC